MLVCNKHLHYLLLQHI